MLVRTQQFKTAGLQSRKAFASPPPRQTVPVDRVTYSESTNLFEPKWVSSAVDETEAKLSGGQVALLGLGVLAAFGGAVGAVVSFSSQAPITPVKPKVEHAVSHSQISTPSKVELAKPAAIEKRPDFSEGRTLLVDRSSKVHAHQFDPDPSMALEMRGSTPLFDESYIADLVNRDLTNVPEGAPRFTALGVDSSQSSKVYFDADLKPVEFGHGSLKSGKFFTRPTRMNGRGAGITDNITQYHLSCVYRLTQPATVDGVKLEPGVYRLISMDPASNVATPSMQRSVCPGHTLVPSGSGISGDYVPRQQTKEGETLHVNPDDIVQIWTLTEQEAAKYQ